MEIEKVRRYIMPDGTDYCLYWSDGEWRNRTGEPAPPEWIEELEDRMESAHEFTGNGVTI